MEVSSRKSPKRLLEPVDEWLRSEGFFRKHAPRDPTCLFRAVSEQVYATQYYHLRVRRKCIEFMKNNKDLFEGYINASFESYLEQMAYFTEWGGIPEIHAMSLLYKREFVVFNGQKQVRKTVTNNGFKEILYLCYTPQKQYESVYTRNFATTAAYCQSIVYEVLYEGVFGMTDIQSTVNKMLHDRSGVFKHHKFFLKRNVEIRDQLTMELYNKLGTNTNKTEEETEIVQKSTTPFPYRVAKALCPNIYRNIDFDVWLEIRREVKSAGWSRYNSHELQVGGKCLVQIHFSEEDYDIANNNSLSLCSLGQDADDNESKIEQKRTKSPEFFCGHIQEMSKDQGPVVVFIEELGEKKSVPYSALKPLPVKKNRLSFVSTYQRNAQASTNQKWKDGTGARKVKETVTSVNVFSSSYDKNGNQNNNVNNNNENHYTLRKWNEGSLKMDHQQTYEHYAVEKSANFAVNSSSEVYTSTTLVGDKQELSTESIGQEEVPRDSQIATPSHTNVGNDNANLPYNNTNLPPTNSDCNAEFNTPTKQKRQKDAYYPPYSEDSSGTLGNTKPLYTISDGNSLHQMNQMVAPINCSVERSVDENGQDLPLSDPLTLRFFYNLGLEYYRACNTREYASNDQVDAGQWYQGAPPNDAATNLGNGLQTCHITERAEEYSSSKDNNKDIVETPVKAGNITKNIQAHRSETPRGESPRESYSNRGKPKDYANGYKESYRPKRNLDYRNRNVGQQTNSLQQRTNGPQQNRSPNGYKQQEPRNDNRNCSSSFNTPQPVPLPISPTSYPPYMQQGMCVPYYGGEYDAFGNTYYPPSPGFVPVPCIPHTDVPDNSNMPPFPPHVYPGMDCTQEFPGVCAPIMCPPGSPYVYTQNMPEHWYAIPGQRQFAPVVPVPSEYPPNTQTSEIQ